MKRPHTPRIPFATLLGAILTACFVATLASAQPAPASGPTWKDQGESDIGIAAGGETDLVKKLDLLKKWEQQYPDTALKAQRTFMTTQTLTGLITAAFNKPEGPVLDAGRKAAQQLIDGAGMYFDESLRALPQLAQVTPEQWTNIRKTSGMQAHALFAYSATLKKDDAGAEAEYKEVLVIDPTQAATSYQLGALIIHEIAISSNFTRFSEALWDLARSLAVTGPNALPPAGQAAASKFLKANYQNYHDSDDGLADLMKQAADSAMPPPGFHIMSKVEIADAKAKDHAAWAAAHPEQDFWETIKATLLDKGDAYFTSLQGVGFPPPPSDTYKGQAMFKAKVISQPNPKQLLVSVDNVPTGDALLKFDDNIKGVIPADTEIQFKGVVDAWTKDPAYVLTFVIQEPTTDIVGLPAGISFVPDAAAKPKPGPKGPVKAAPKATPKAPAK